MIYQNGITLSDEEIARLKQSANRQSKAVASLLKIHPQGLTANEVHDTLTKYNIIRARLTSVRRALHNLDKDTDSPVYKTDRKRDGGFGVDIHIYKYRADQTQASMFETKHKGAFSQ